MTIDLNKDVIAKLLKGDIVATVGEPNYKSFNIVRVAAIPEGVVAAVTHRVVAAIDVKSIPFICAE